MMAATASLVAMGLSLMGRFACDYEAGAPTSLACYSDVTYLWQARYLDQHVAPWVGTPSLTKSLDGPALVQLAPGQVEYPPLTSLFIWLTSLMAHDAKSFLVVTALALAPFAALTAWVLVGLTGRRALIFAFSPQLLMYGLLNWDVLPVASCVFAIAAFRRQKFGWVGIFLAIGAWSKVWPGFLLITLLLELAASRRFGRAGTAVAGFLLVSLTVNVPWLVINPLAWIGPFQMQTQRANDLSGNSVWRWLLKDQPIATVNLTAGTAVMAAWCVLLCWQWLGLGARNESWISIGGCLVATYVMLGRVDSPQYGLWLVPFLVVVTVPVWVVALACASDVAFQSLYSVLSRFYWSFIPEAVLLRLLSLAASVVALSGISWSQIVAGISQAKVADLDGPGKRPAEPDAAVSPFEESLSFGKPDLANGLASPRVGSCRRPRGTLGSSGSSN